MSAINIITPVYNSCSYLDDYFNSLLAQDFDDFTLIIVDAASTDDSSLVIERFLNSFKNEPIYYKSPEPLSAGPARNIGLKISEDIGSLYTVSVDSDDYVSPNYLSSMKNTAEREKVDLAICGITRVNDKTGEAILTEALSQQTNRITNLPTCSDLAYINPAPYNKLFRSQAIKGIRFPDMRRSEDTCFFFTALPYIHSLAYTNELSYFYRIREDSLTTSFDYGICESMFDGFQQTGSLFQDDKYLPFREAFVAQVFIRCAVGGVTRASFANIQERRTYVRNAYSYMEEVFPQWRKNKFLSLFETRNNFKKFAIAVCAALYKFHCFGAFILFYKYMVEKLGVDARF